MNNKSYAKEVSNKTELLITIFSGAFNLSIDKVKLLGIEVLGVGDILINGESRNITVKDTPVLKFDAKEIHYIYSKLIRGLEIDLIKEYSGSKNKFDSLTTAKALSNYYNFLKEIVNGSVNENINKTQITGFKTTLTEQQQGKLYKALQNNYIDCTEAQFKAMFTNKPKPIKWIDTGTKRHEPNKQTIFEFIYLLNEYKHLESPQTDLDTKATNQNNQYRKLEFLFPDIKNFAQSSGTGKSAKNTPRKKELEDIIKAL